MPKPLTDHNKLWKILKEMGIPDHMICLLRNLYASKEATVRTKYGTTDWFQIGKGVHQGLYCHLAYLNYMQITSCKMPGWMKPGVKIARRNINNFRYIDDIIYIDHIYNGRKQRGNKEPLDESERGE